MTGSEPPRWAARLAPPPAPVDGAGPGPGPRTLRVALSGAIGPADVAALRDAVAGLLAGSRARLVLCDVSGLTEPGLATVDALARIQLTAARLGRRIRFCAVPRELLELMVLAGLEDVLQPAPGSDRPGTSPP